MPVEAGFDFAQLDSVAPDFDLEVESPQQFDFAILVVTGQVARSVGARFRSVRGSAVREGMRDELLRGLLGIVQITSSQAVAGN